MAAHGPACIYLCARTIAKAESAISRIHEHHSQAKIHAVQLDLASLESVKAAAAEIDKTCDHIDVLFLNAGVAGVAAGLTQDGYEINFGTNHLGHALLTQLLMPKLLKATEAPAHDVRVIAVSSEGAVFFATKKGLDLSAVRTDMASTSVMSRYAQSKLANIYFAQKLAQQYPSVVATAPHPGTVKTEIFDKATGFGFVMKLLAPVALLFAYTAEDGAKQQLWCGFGKGVESGKYYQKIGDSKPRGKHMSDEKLRDELWEWTNAELAKYGAPGWPKA